MNDRIDTVFGQGLAQRAAVGNVGNDQFGIADSFGVPLTQIVVHHAGMPIRLQRTDHVRSDVPRPAG